MPKRLSTVYLPLLSSLILAGCTATNPAANAADALNTSTSSDEARAEQTQADAERLAELIRLHAQQQLHRLSGGATFNVLSAEMYAQRGEYASAAEHYARLSTLNDAATLERGIQMAILGQRFDIAGDLANQLHELQPNSARAAAARTISALQLEDLPAARTGLNRWLSADDATPRQVFNEIGEYLQNSVEPGTAMRFTGYIAQNYPDSYDAQLISAKLALGFDAPELALTSAKKARSIEPDRTLPHDFVIMIQSELGNVDATLDALEQAHHQFPAELRYISGLIEARIADGQTDAAALLLENTLDSGIQSADMLRNFAMFAQQLEKPSLVNRSLDALAATPGNADAARLLRGRFALEQDDLPAAEQALTEISPQAEHYVSAQILIAGVRADLDKNAQAIEGLERLVAKEDLSREQKHRAYGALTGFLLEFGYREQAIDALSDALAVWPEDKDFLMRRAMAYFFTDQVDRAVTDLQQIIALDGDHAPALNALGYTFADENRNLDEAHELITRALELDPKNPAYLDSLGWVKYRMGELETASQVLADAFELEPNAEIGAHLGVVLWDMGEKENARAIWRQSIELDANESTLREAVDKNAPELWEEAPLSENSAANTDEY